MRGKDRILNLPISLLLSIQMLGGMVVAPCFAFLPVYLQDLGLSVVFISAVVTLQRVSGLVASVIGGGLTDTLGRKPTLVLGQIGYFAGILVFLLPSPGPVLLLWSLCGFGLGLLTLGGQGYLMDHANARFLGVLTALYYWGYTLGSTLSNTVTGLVLERLGYRGVGIGLLALGALTMGITLLALPGSSSRGDPGDEKSHSRGGVISGYREVAARPGVLLLAVLRFLPTFCYGMLTVFVPLLLRAAGAQRSTIGFYAAISSVSASLAQLGAGRLADKIGPRRPATVAYLVLGASSLCISLTSTSLVTVFVLGAGGIAAAWSLSTLMTTMVARAVGAAERGRALGLIHLFWNLAMILGALVGGFLYDRSGGLPFAVGGAAVLLAIPVLARFFRYRDHSSTDSARIPEPPSTP